MRRVLICGSRDWLDYDAILSRLCRFPRDTVVIHGGCRGADTLAGEAALYLGMEEERHLADWNRYGRRAGPIRNRAMLDTKPDLVLAFHHDLPASRGTRNCVTEARRRGIPVEVIE